MAKLFCVMGKSSTGKDTIYKRLLDRSDLGLKQVIPYTTRPIRHGENEGVEYHFVDSKERDRLLDDGKVIEIRSYNTVYGIWDYFTVDDGQIDLNGQDALVIGTLETYYKLRVYFGNEAVVPIYINVEDGERLTRALNREKKQALPKYEEMCRRFIADSADFSEAKIKEAGIDKKFENVDLDDTVEEIAKFIASYR